MKKLCVLLLTLCLILGLAACGEAEKPAATEAPLPEETLEPTPEPTPEGLTADDLAGYWHLSDDNSMRTLREDFSQLAEKGACMQILPNGQITWTMGAEGATGSFRIDGNLLEATLTDDVSGDPLRMTLVYSEKNGHRTLSMDVKSMLVYWSPGKGDGVEDWPGAWKLELEAALWATEGIRPLSYDDLGDGIYQIFVEEGGQEVPWAKVDSATGQILPEE